MAKIERYINEDFDQLLSKIESGIINGSMSATLEDVSDFRSGTVRCSVRVFMPTAISTGCFTPSA